MNIYLILLYIFSGMVYLGLFWIFPMIGFSIKDGLETVGLIHLIIFICLLIISIFAVLIYKSGILL